MAEKIYEMTYEGIKNLQDELDQRKTVNAAEISERLKEARALGDLSENSEYDDAKTAQAENEMRIMEIESILKNARLIEEDEISKTKVSLGAVVKLRDEETQEEMEYLLVGNKEQDIFNNKIASDSPVGAAIIGKKKGQLVDVRTPSGILRYRIVKISRPS
ncbi:MAG: transcription elongation factor GreA [Ruminococcaceae bacterium]|jgi:transcription elongation factor GreA|nr:transcription elongation factor GreA [Oscillospiraceae bacterium]